MKKLQMTKAAFDLAKEQFRKVFKKHKSQVARAKREKRTIGRQVSPVEPYDLKIKKLKKDLRGTRVLGTAEFKARPGLKSRLKAGIRRAKRAKAKHKGPMIIGKAFASDKKGKGMHIPMASASQMKAIRSDIGRATKEFYEKARFKKFGYDKGGDIKALKTVSNKLKKASKAHAGQSKVLKRIISKYV